MGLLLRLAVSAAILLGFVYAADYTADWPIDPTVRGWNDWINSLVISPEFAAKWGLTHEVVMYLRNLVLGTIQYQVGSGLWSLYLYVLRRKHFFPDPSKVADAEPAAARPACPSAPPVPPAPPP